jgi:hypothetical protein
MGNVVRFDRHRTHQTPIRIAAVPLPNSATIILNDEALDIDPRARIVERYHCPEPAPEPPSMRATAGEVVVDLGDVTPARTLLRFSPEDAEAWARELALAATLAKQQQGR